MDLTKFGIGKNNNDNNEISNKPEEEKLVKINTLNDNKNLEINISEIKKEIKEDKDITEFLPWFIKYQIKDINDLIITPEINKIIEFFENPIKKKGLLLVGPPGTGKTTTINVLANHYNYEIFEVNASDNRNKKSIEETIGDVINQKSLFNQKKLILVDEVDGISGTYDRGGLNSIIKLMKSTNIPFVFTANNEDSDKIKSLKKVCIYINFENHSKTLLKKLAEKILTKENIKYNETDLENFIKERDAFDIRGFINDLQASVIDKKLIVDDSIIEIRNYKKKINKLLTKIIYSNDDNLTNITYETDINLDDLFLYLEENLPKIYSSEALSFSFEQISKGDVFRGRITKWQYWRFLVYVNYYLTEGINMTKNISEPNKITEFKKNNRILKKWIFGNKYSIFKPKSKTEKEKNKELNLIEKISKIYGRSVSKTRKEDVFYFCYNFKYNPKFRENIIKELELNEKEIEGIDNFIS